MSSDEPQSGKARQAPNLGSGSVGRLARWLPASWRPANAVPDAASKPLAPAPPAATEPPVDEAPTQPGSLDPAYRRERARSGEAEQLWFRTDRIFRSDGAWYFATREGIDVGPYEHREDARRDAKSLIRLLAQNPPHDVQAATLTIQQFMERPKFRHRG
jgi:hypothetical protein